MSFNVPARTQDGTQSYGTYKYITHRNNETVLTCSHEYDKSIKIQITDICEFRMNDETCPVNRHPRRGGEDSLCFYVQRDHLPIGRAHIAGIEERSVFVHYHLGHFLVGQLQHL